MDPGEGSFMGDDDLIEEDLDEDCFNLDDIDIDYAFEDDYEMEMEDFAALGVLIGFVSEAEERTREKLAMSDDEVDRAIDEMAANSKGYCRMRVCGMIIQT